MNEKPEIITNIIPNIKTELTLLQIHIHKLNIYEKDKGKWYIKSHDSEEKEKLVYNENTGKSAPEEIVRQLYLFELIDDYNYPRNRIKTEESVNFGREKKRADIVVYQEDNITPWIIVEVKAPNQKLNLQQLKSYLNAEGSPMGVGINGKEKAILYRPYPKQFEDNLPDISTEIEYQEVKISDNPILEVSDTILNRKWTLKELEEKNKETAFNLRGIIELLEELVLANSGADSFTEIFKMIYAKLYDEFEAKNREGEQLKFRKYKDSKTTFKVISKLFDDARNEWKGVFEKSDKIKLTPEHLSVCVGELQNIKLFGTNLRIIDEAFEYLVPDVSKSKKGQYFTPRVIIDTCVRILNPSRKEYIIDPACGSAGFLVHSMEYVWAKYNMNDYQTKSHYAGRYLWGIDFEEKSTKISRAIMLIAGDGKSHIFKENSLEFSKWDSKLNNALEGKDLIGDEENRKLKFDILMTNPPFAGEIKENWLKALYSIVPEGKVKSMGSAISRHILFIERALDMIKPGGRMVIVLPQGIFNNTNGEYIRKFIMKKARILGVVGLNGNSFKPHTGTKTSLLFLRKWKKKDLDEGENPKLKDYPIFFAVSKISFKDNSGEYIFTDRTNKIYQTDLFDISDAFIKWGKERLESKDRAFDFLDEGGK
jgi:type I restriction enzyme M protein